jgi:hypothetical protein
MKIKDHWVVFSPSGAIVGESHISEQAAWYDAEDKTGDRRDELRLIGYRCKIEEASE